MIRLAPPVGLIPAVESLAVESLAIQSLGIHVVSKILTTHIGSLPRTQEVVDQIFCPGAGAGV